MKVVGLTGGIATGKSTVASFLREMDVPVVDADQVAREVVGPGTQTLQALVIAFAPHEILDERGQLDRGAMREQITRDPHAKRTLESITHPAIRRSIAERLKQLADRGHPAAVVEAALLVETGSYRLYPCLIVVTCRPEVQLARLMARDALSEPQARAMISTQLPLRDKEAVATHLIRNDGDLEGLRRQVECVWSSILKS